MGTDVQRPSGGCYSCGHAVDARALTCPSCGVPLRVIKDRSLAILLAVLLSFLAWSYTYAGNRLKFWIGCALTVLGAALALAGTVWVTLCVVVWIWAILDNALKPTEYYLQYRARWKQATSQDTFWSFMKSRSTADGASSSRPERW
jgi:hypothetical protein